MAKKTANSAATGVQKPRKPRTAIEKVFVVSSGGEHRLVAGISKRKVEAAVWRRPVVRIATPTDLRELTSAGVLIEPSEPTPAGQMRTDEPDSDQGSANAEQGTDSASS